MDTRIKVFGLPPLPAAASGAHSFIETPPNLSERHRPITAGGENIVRTPAFQKGSGRERGGSFF